MRPIEELLRVMQRLRDPQTGCSWDIQQNFKSIAPYTIEEAYEVADAIERENPADLQDELGDLLLQVVFHAQMADEQDLFDFDDVSRSIVDKMVRRHPHVFGDTRYQTETEQKAAWDALKARERADKSATAKTSALDGIASNLPALKQADKVQTRAARVGFDWQEVAPVWDKMHEELSEVQQALSLADADAIEDEVGDLLFTVVNLARHLSVDAESALRRSTRKFDCRFRQIEVLAEQQQTSLPQLSPEALDELWNTAKTINANMDTNASSDVSSGAGSNAGEDVDG